MPENSIQSTLRETFPSANKEVWKRIASQELEGKSPDEVLSWNSEDQIRFFAYYDGVDEEQNPLSQNFHLTVADDPYFGPAKWLNIPCITVTSEKKANATALQHLTNGADGILFRIKEKINFENLLKDIDWRYCSLFFEAPNMEIFISELESFVSENKIQLSKTSGGLFWESIPNFKNNIIGKENFLKNFITVSPSTSASEIAEALSLGIEFFERSEKHSEEFFETISFSIPVNGLFMETIAKLKALRILWYQVGQAFGYSSYEVGDLQIHARSEKWIAEKFQPHGNLLKSTTACMASVIGGANVITLDAEDETNSTMDRIARNVSSLLREEAHLDKVSDPSSGAYAIDAMTNEFAKLAWKIFQEGQKK
jgi:methylmalonyl-CoA mutase